MNNTDTFWSYYYSTERQSLSDQQAHEIIEKVKRENPTLTFEQRVAKIRQEMQDLLFKHLYGN